MATQRKIYNILIGQDPGSVSQIFYGAHIEPTGKLDIAKMKQVEFFPAYVLTSKESNHKIIPQVHNGNTPQILDEPLAGFYGEDAYLRKPDEWTHKISIRFYNEPAFLLLQLGGVADILEALNVPSDAEVRIILSIGLAVSHMSYKDMISARLKDLGTFALRKRHGKLFEHVSFSHINIYPQPYFVGIDQMAKWVTEEKKSYLNINRDYCKGRKGICDFGGNTTNFAIFVGSLNESKMDGDVTGTWAMIQELKSFLNQELKEESRDWDEIELMDILRTGKVKIGNKEFTCTEFIRSLYESKWHQLEGRAESVLRGGGKIQGGVNLAGGGAYGYLEFLRNYYGKTIGGGIELATDDNGNPEPQHSMVRGTLKASYLSFQRLLKEKKAKRT